MTEDEDFSFTFSDEDFERRYSSEELVGPSSRSAAQQPKPSAGQPSRSRFMRTLLRRRLAASQSRV